MKHYFYFKKGQIVPQWLLRQRDGDTNEVLQFAQFKVNGKVMVDDKTGHAVIWPASKRFHHIIYVNCLNRTIQLDTDDNNSINSFFGYAPRHTLAIFSIRNNDTRTSPLTNARRGGLDVRSTTKCIPIPYNFDRRGGCL